MPATYTVTTGRSQRLSYSGDVDGTELSWMQSYEVEVSGVTANTVDAYDVGSATGIPITNRTVYAPQGNIIPFVICRSKTVEQDPKRLSRWYVRATFKGQGSQEESDNQPTDPSGITAVTDYTPHEVPIFEETQRALYIDKSANGGKRYVSPSGSQWTEPLVERLPLFSLKITQYEAVTDYLVLINRMFKCNEKTYRNQGRYRWMITGLERTVVDTEISSGSTTACIVTYTVSYSPFEHGWKKDLALIDTHFIDGNGDRQPFKSTGTPTLTSGFIKDDGTARPDAEQPYNDTTSDPDRIQYESQKTIDFDTFLQV